MIITKMDDSELAAFIGSTQAFLGEVKTPVYLDDLLRYAHATAAKRFDEHAAAYATATQKINHMFEWGTEGINPTPTAPALNPLSPMARLWRHKFTGRGGQRKIDYEFRASMVPVPLPLPSSQDESSSYEDGSKLPSRKHIFYWKAPVMEYGITVHIKPRYAKALWIPLRGEPMTEDNRAIERGFVMTKKTITNVPGRRFAGEFTKLWVGWWSTEGTILIDTIANEASSTDAAAVIASNSMKARRYVRGGRLKRFSLNVDTARATAQAQMLAESKSRRARANAMEDKEKLTGSRFNR